MPSPTDIYVAFFTPIADVFRKHPEATIADFPPAVLLEIGRHAIVIARATELLGRVGAGKPAAPHSIGFI